MYNLRLSSQYRHGTISLSITGPKDLIRERVLVTAQLTDTWLHVFNQQLNFGLNPEDGYYVRRTSPQPGIMSRDGNGWECELDEEISVFVNKFNRNHPRHAAVLCRRRSRDNQSLRDWASSSLSQPTLLIPHVEIGAFSVPTADMKVEEMEGNRKISSLFSLPSLMTIKRDRNLEGPSTSMAVVTRDAILNEGQDDKLEEEEEDDEGQNNKRQRLGWGRDDDLDSLATGVGRQLSVLNEKGISVEEARAKFVKQVGNCSNNLILGVIGDVLKQQDKPSWERFVQKMPSLCHFLDKVVNKSN